MKNRYLVVYNYGQGGAWAYVYADSEAQIKEKYPELKIVSRTPTWMTEELERRIETDDSYDIDDTPAGLLEDILGARESE